MGLFGLFKKPVKIQDDFFGELRFMDFNDASKNYFEGRGYFAPTNNETEYLIHANNEGPTEIQRNFYRDLQANFKQYVEKIKPLIEDEFRNWKEDFLITDFYHEFRLVCVVIPRLENKPLIWEMAFDTIHDLNHQVTIEFTGDQPTGILIDG
ncbi:hypothetical protein [Foetidibacter luteolus]|uniref:hypothetical protein n=1 Tax=Foetidibacter luteolus TaxID=2608880 RepID=UPI00129BE1F2|nr:hypothetical protein [Foetidibacter luteolus]